MNATQKISVIVPVHNGADHLHHQLKALLSCPSAEIEVLVIDDGSTDATWSLMQNYAEQDARLRIFSQKQTGPGAARNLGLSKARGIWVAFADADDFMLGKELFRWMNQAEKQKLDLLIGSLFRFEDDPELGIKPSKTSQPTTGRVMSGCEWIEHCDRNNDWPHYVWIQLIKRRLITEENLAFHPEIFHEDVIWTAELALRAKRVGFDNMPVYGYRRNRNSIVSSGDIGRLIKRAESYIYIIERLLQLSKSKNISFKTKSALKRQAFHELRCFSSLLRKNIDDPPIQAKLAAELMEKNYPINILCLMSPLRYFHLLKTYWRLRRIANSSKTHLL